MIGPIQLKREGTSVRLSFEAYINALGNRVFSFDWEAGSEWAASLLYSAIEKYLGEQLQKVKKSAYDKGWKDAKARNKRQTEFFGDFDIENL